MILWSLGQSHDHPSWERYLVSNDIMFLFFVFCFFFFFWGGAETIVDFIIYTKVMLYNGEEKRMAFF